MDKDSGSRLKASDGQIEQKLKSLGVELKEFRREFEGYHRRVIKALVAVDIRDNQDDSSGG